MAQLIEGSTCADVLSRRALWSKGRGREGGREGGRGGGREWEGEMRGSVDRGFYLC